MKKGTKIAIIVLVSIFAVLFLVGYGIRLIFMGPSVGLADKKRIETFSEEYLTKKYGEHHFKVTGVKYEYHSTTLFDYSDPTGYWVDFTSDVVADSWLKISGLTPGQYKVNTDHLIESIYLPKMGYDAYKKMEELKPKEAMNEILLDKLKNEFDPNIYEMNCDSMQLAIPDDYGKIPTLEEIKSNTSLYEARSFIYKVPNKIENKEEYESRLRAYVSSNFGWKSKIYFFLDDTMVNVSMTY